MPGVRTKASGVKLVGPLSNAAVSRNSKFQAIIDSRMFSGNGSSVCGID
jgi:hypothetical protein